MLCNNDINNIEKDIVYEIYNKNELSTEGLQFIIQDINRIERKLLSIQI